jgi:hypothetical protein
MFHARRRFSQAKHLDGLVVSTNHPLGSTRDGVPNALILLAFSAAKFAFLEQIPQYLLHRILALIVGKAFAAPRFSFGSLASSFLPRETPPAPTAILIRFGFLTHKSIASH